MVARILADKPRHRRPWQYPHRRPRVAAL